MLIRRALQTTLLLLLWLNAALAEQPVPRLAARITDLTGTLSSSEIAQLESQAAALEQSKGSQVAVLIVSTTEPETIEQYSIRVASAWKLGRRGVDDGVLLVVAKNDRKVRIEVGYGLEGALTDIQSKRIIEEFIVPRFRAGDFFGGISEGLGAIIKVVSGEQLPMAKRAAESDPFPMIFTSVIAALIAGSFFQSYAGRVAAGAVMGGLSFIIVSIIASLVAGLIAGAIVFVLLAFGDVNGGGRGGRYSSRSSSWSGGGWSSGGGGFSGGGGSFGGGGASGSW